MNNCKLNEITIQMGSVSPRGSPSDVKICLTEVGNRRLNYDLNKREKQLREQNF